MIELIKLFEGILVDHVVLSELRDIYREKFNDAVATLYDTKEYLRESGEEFMGYPARLNGIDMIKDIAHRNLYYPANKCELKYSTHGKSNSKKSRGKKTGSN